MTKPAIRVRFAPSPTGHLHIGGARTALFNWAFAKANGGSFVLRIEDTDATRSRPEHTQQILSSLQWLGLNWDEGPFLQSERADYYQQCINQLIEHKLIYPVDVDADVSVDADAEDGQPGTNPAYRLAVPQNRIVEWDDLVYGHIAVDTKEIDDFIVVRSDGIPTYNLAVVLDDHAMHISHVIRGDDHISNTPKQILLYEALAQALPNYTANLDNDRLVPEFAHLPMVLGSDGQRLSKRHGATSVEEFRAAGYLPDALLNYIALLGWSKNGETSIVTPVELSQIFSLERVNRKAAVFDTEKLDWTNGEYIKQLSPADFVNLWQEYLFAEGVVKADFAEYPSQFSTITAWLEAMVPLLQPRIKRMVEANQLALPLFAGASLELDPTSVEKGLLADPAATQTVLTQTIQLLEDAKLKWTLDDISDAFAKLPELTELKPKVIFAILRVAIMGNLVSLPLNESVSLLQREHVIERLRKASGIPAVAATQN